MHIHMFIHTYYIYVHAQVLVDSYLRQHKQRQQSFALTRLIESNKEVVRSIERREKANQVLFSTLMQDSKRCVRICVCLVC